MKHKKWSDKKIGKFVAKWQKRLRLQDWRVTVEYKRARDLSGEGRSAEIGYILNHKHAIITLADPLDIPADFEYNVKRSLIHELLHIHIKTFFDETADNNKMFYVEWEQVISILTDALLEDY